MNERGGSGDGLLSSDEGRLRVVTQVSLAVTAMAFLACASPSKVVFSLPDLITGSGDLKSETKPLQAFDLLPVQGVLVVGNIWFCVHNVRGNEV